MRACSWIAVAAVLAGCGGPQPGRDASSDRPSIDIVEAGDIVDAADMHTDDIADVAPSEDGIDAMDATDDTTMADGFDALDAFDGFDTGIDTIDIDGTIWIPYGSAGCNGRIRPTPLQPALHVDPDAGPISWFTDPPSSGPHYPIWAHWGAFPDIPPGYWVHNLEHGGVVFLYQCPSGMCDGLVTQLQAVAATIPDDLACMPTEDAPARLRLVITSYPVPDAAFAAVAWGWIYEADCIDPDALRQFFIDHHGMAPEDFCFDGYYP